MMARSQKSQYTEKENRSIYILLSPLSNEFFIGHCKTTLLKDVFKQHYYGERYQTKECFTKLKEENLHPCLFILEELFSTKVEAYNYVIAWTKIFSENGYTNLNQGNILNYINDLNENNQLIYNKNAKNKLEILCNCERCIVSIYNRRLCKLYKGNQNETK